MSLVAPTLLANLAFKWGPKAAGAILKLSQATTEMGTGASPTAFLNDAIANTDWEEFFNTGKLKLKNEFFMFDNPWDWIHEKPPTQDEMQKEFDAWQEQQSATGDRALPMSILIEEAKIKEEEESKRKAESITPEDLGPYILSGISASIPTDSIVSQGIKRVKCWTCDETGSCSEPWYSLRELVLLPEQSEPQTTIPLWYPPASTTTTTTPQLVPLPHLDQTNLIESALTEQDEKYQIHLAENETLYNLRPRKYSENDADPIISEHAIHWLICTETYEPTRKIILGLNSDWHLFYDDEETCVYRKPDLSNIIIGFRGTKETKDLYDDALLSFGKVFPRAVEAKNFTENIIKSNPGSTIQTTGHSLGGAIARVVCEQLGIQGITFNAAAPPTSPVTSCLNSKDYHIVYDVISAWQSPNTIRIDKGFDPIATFWQKLNLALHLYSSFTDIIDSHHLYHFSNERTGKIVTASEENDKWNKWWRSLPPVISWTGVLGYILGKLISLPTIN